MSEAAPETPDEIEDVTPLGQEPVPVDEGPVELAPANEETIEVRSWGDQNLWRTITRFHNEEMSSTMRGMLIPGAGVVLHHVNERRNQDGSYVLGESMCFVPDASILEMVRDGSVHARIVARKSTAPPKPKRAPRGKKK